MAKSELEQHKDYVAAQLGKLSPLLQDYALGDFSKSIEIPKEESEFTELLVGLSLMVDDIKEMIREREDTISRLKQADEALRAGEEKYRSMIMNLGEGFYSATLDGTLLDHNNEFNRILGFDLEQNLVGAQLPDFWLNPKDRKAYLEQFREHGSIKSYLVAAKKRNGEGIFVEISSRLVRDEQGKPARLEGTFIDVTRRVRAQQSLQESEKRLSTTLMSIGDAVIATDAQGLVTLINPVAEDLTGWSEADAVGQPLEDVFNIINEQTGEQVESPVARVLRDGVVVGLANHTVLIARDGTKRPIADSGAPIRDEEENIIGTILVFRDITERSRAEKELLLKNIVFQSAVAANSIAGNDGVITHVNPAFLKLWGYETEEAVIGNSVASFFVNEEDAIPMIETLNETGKWAGDFFATRRDNSTFISRGFATVVRNEQGEQIGFQSANHDVTAEKEAEDELRKYQGHLEELVKERTGELLEAQEQLVRREKLAVLGQLAGGVGHELRNPLGAIKNAAYFLKMVLPEGEGEPDPEIREMLEVLEKEVDRSEKIISSLLDFARVRPPARRRVDVNDVVQDALSRSPPTPRVEVLCQLDEDLPLILADPDQLFQVFGNLIRNAIQAMTPLLSRPNAGEKGEGRLVIRTAVESSEWVTVSVADSGAGISEENLKKIFEPLFSTKAKGIGLGLAVVKTLVEGHGGSIEVKTEQGKGTSFSVRLPLGASAAVKEEEV